MSKNIVSMVIDGESYTARPYGTCTTAASTPAKVVTCADFSLCKNTTILVYFQYANTASNPTLNVNGTGAKSIFYREASLTSSLYQWGAGDTCEFIYDGTNYKLLTVSNTNDNTKNTAGATDTSAKIYLVGATTQEFSPVTYTHNTVYVDTDGCLYSNDKKVSIEHDHPYAPSKHNHSALEITTDVMSVDRLPAGSTSAKGIVQLTNSTSSTSTTTAATPNSVKSAYDLANTAKAAAANAQGAADSKVPTSRKVNGKALSSDITLSASDVGAYSKTEIDSKVSTLNDDINGKAPADHSHSIITISDIRDTNGLPSQYDEYSLSTFFNNTDLPAGVGAWKSGIHVKGWTQDYNAWELASDANNSKLTDPSLYFRTGYSDTWGDWKKLIDDKGGTITGNLTVPSIVNSRKNSATMSEISWYRIFTSNNSDVAGDTVNFVLSHNWNNSPTETYEFSVSVGYDGNIAITQLSGVIGSGIISKIRVVYKKSDIYYIDFYNSYAMPNDVSVYGTGAGTFQAPTAVDSIPADGYNTYEFETVNGCKSDKRFYGDLAGNADTAKILTGSTGDGVDVRVDTGTLKHSFNVSADTPDLFPTYNNANSVITLNKHFGDYDSQLGFSSDGNIYYRNFNAIAKDAKDEQGKSIVSWERLAFSSAVDKKADCTKWTCPTEVNANSRLCQLDGYGLGLLTLTLDQNGQAVVYTYLIGTSYNYVSINQIGYSSFPVYNDQIVRITADSSAVRFNIELLNTYAYTGSTVLVKCSYVTLSNGQNCMPHTGETAWVNPSDSFITQCKSKTDGMVVPKIYGDLTGNINYVGISAAPTGGGSYPVSIYNEDTSGIWFATGDGYSIRFPNYSKGMFVSNNGGDATLIVTAPDGTTYTAFRNNGDWTAARELSTTKHTHNYLTCAGRNNISSITDDTTPKWGQQGNSVHFYDTTGYLKDQPSQFGFILNMTDDRKSDVHQIWAEQSGKDLYHRGGNNENIATTGGWTGTWMKILDSKNYTEYALPKSGGTITGNLTVTGSIDGTATRAIQDGNGNDIASTYLPKSGGTITGDMKFNGTINNRMDLNWPATTGAIVLNDCDNNYASGKYAIAAGYRTTAKGVGGLSIGCCTDTASTASGSTAITFIAGCGYVNTDGTTVRSNSAFLTSTGSLALKGNVVANGADYSEFFEWEDGNINAEDRRGYFVTMVDEKIRIARPNDYILGIISGQPTIIGNGDIEWCGRYLRDEFGSYITENVEYVDDEVVDEETGKITYITKIGPKYKQNPDYDPERLYVHRKDRPEWDAVGIMGVLPVRDDGTCKVNGYCTVSETGTATASDTGYRVIARVNENIVKVVLK